MPKLESASFGGQMGLVGKLGRLHWSMIATICIIAGIGFATLYSVAGGDFGLGGRQLARFVLGMGLMIAIALIHIRVWWNLAYVAYGVALALLVAVEFAGMTGGGAQRWIDIGLFNLQPSELMKIALVLALARYFHGRTQSETEAYSGLIIPVLLVAAPAVLVLRQPDLGTMLLLIMGSAGIFFLTGVRARIFVIAIIASLVAIPVALNSMRDYQRARVMTFLNPGDDPLGAGYHIQQSKIALGSGGLTGKGYMEGTQGHLDFLPEKQTDFIFTSLAEEFGFFGAVTLLALYGMLIAQGTAIGLAARSQFARLVALGVMVTFFLYVFINMAMVMGLVPVVGVPLPFVSYAGSAMVTLLIGLGLVLNAHIYRDVTISRQGYMR